MVLQALFCKGMHAIFRKRAKQEQKKAKYLKIWAKMYKIWKDFEKEQLMRAGIARLKQLEYALYCSNKNCQGGRCIRE